MSAPSNIDRKSATHATPDVHMGDSVALPDAPVQRQKNRPGLLGPWLAAGFGLAVLAAVPNEGSTSPAGAAAPPRAAAPAAAAAFTSADSLAQLPLVSPASGTVAMPSVAAMLDIATIEWGERQTRNAVNEGPGAPHASGPVEEAVPQWTARSLGVTTAPVPVVEAPTDEDWAALRWCESSNNYGAVNASGRYRGAYQFDLATWESVGGAGDPAAASPDEQDLRARRLFESRGSAPWPFCGRYLD